MYSPDRQATHCTYCGTRFAEAEGWPRDCPGCGQTTWANPYPVAVTLLPITDAGHTRLLVVRRSISPGFGLRALPGGYIELGETWQEAAVRELWEEARVEAEAAEVRFFHLGQSPRTIQIFGLLPHRPLAALPPSAPTEEADGWELIDGPVELAFPTHTAAATEFFAPNGHRH